MIRSMTGYCSIREEMGDDHILLEIKTLNHRGFDLHFHAPRPLAMLEVPLRDLTQRQIRRGRIEFYLRGNQYLAGDEKIRANPEIARQYLNAAQSIAGSLQLEFHPNANFFLSLDGVMEAEENTLSTDEYWDLLKDLFERAAARVVRMKEQEGERLRSELESLLDRIEAMNDEIDAFRDQINQEYRSKILDRIGELTGSIDLDENRILQEIAHYAERSDIQEEIVRMKSHLQQFREFLEENQSGEPYMSVGRRLDFLCQEMFREINTIGSKSTSLDIMKLVLELKGTVDRLREQVQNVE